VRTSDEKNISAQQCEKKAHTRLPGAHVNEGRPRSHQEASGKGTKTVVSLSTDRNGTQIADPAEAPDHSPLSHRFRPCERLHHPAEYARVKREGRRFRTPHFGLSVADNQLEHHRLGLVVQKRYWSAVGRNRIKRCLREFFRVNKYRIPLPGKDLVVIARPGAQELTPSQIAAELLPILVRQEGRH
jgi:ribonuclease P protein component